jgi:hypothetical protein
MFEAPRVVEPSGMFEAPRVRGRFARHVRGVWRVRGRGARAGLYTGTLKVVRRGSGGHWRAFP